MTDLDSELRRMMNSRAELMTPQASPNTQLAARERTARSYRLRRTFVWFAASAAIVAALAGALAAIQSLQWKSDDPGTTNTATAPSTGPAETPSTAPKQAVPLCRTSQLTGRFPPTGDGAGGTFYVKFILTNTSPTPCLMRGFARVSFVQRSNGQQIGRSAERDVTYRPHQKLVVLPAREGSAAIRVAISQAGNYSPSDCEPVNGVGLRVFPPGNTTSLTAYPAYSVQACSLLRVHQLQATQVLSMNDVN